jgi:hypothetical protein
MIVKEQLEIASRKHECEVDGLYFTRYFFKHRLGTKMIMGRHHAVMQAALDRTMLAPDHPDFISRLIINVPPGYTKTEMAAIHYMARGLAIDQRNRFLHLSYSDQLALQNSASTREVLKSPEYQAMWHIETKEDADSKSIWWTTAGGGVRATSTSGQVTGFRAGHMENDRFTGALIIDDPVKPDDAYSEVKREAINNRYNETIASRVAIETVPIIVIMQRIHYNDLSGYLLRGGSGEKWHHLNLPVIIEADYEYPEEYTHGTQIEHGLKPGWLWPYKHNETHEVALRSHRRKYDSQYAQKPKRRDEEQMVWQDGDIELAHDKLFDTPKRTVVAVDPAASDTKTSDEHGIVAATTHGKDRYTVDQDVSRKGSPKQWADAAIYLYDSLDAAAIVIETNQGGDMAKDTLRNAGFKGKIIGVHASKGKVTRAEPIAALYSQGFVRHAYGLNKLEDEQLDFDPVTGKSNGVSPNRVDACVWALTELSKKSEFKVF